MRLILPQGAVDFDTLGAMLGAFLLEEDTIVLTPERFTSRCESLVAQYAHKLPFAPRSKWIHPDGKHWKLPLWNRMALGMDFLQSLHVAKWLKEKNVQLDPFYASVILLGITTTTNRINSFSVDDEIHAVLDYLSAQGADAPFVKRWMEGTIQLGFERPVIHRMPLASEYAARMPAWQTAIQRVIFEHAWEMGMKVYLVGGVVRDLLLNRPCRDMDFIVEGSALLLGRALESKYGGKLVKHAPFGTARWDLNDAVEGIARDASLRTPQDIAQLPHSIDLISSRTEWYPQAGKLPQVRMDGIELDMQRRDFSVNTLALRIEKDGYILMDACDGLPDLDHQVIRVLHQRSFIDDPTRLFRAVRYEQRLGFRIEPQTEHWMKPGISKLAIVSGDRIRHELNLMMEEALPWRHFQRAEKLGLLKAIHPAWDQLQEEWKAPLHAVLLEDLPEQWYLELNLDHLSLRQLMGYAVLLQNQDVDSVKAISERLMFSADQTHQLCRFVEVFAEKETLKSCSASQFTFRMEHLHDAMLYTLLMLWMDDNVLRDAIIKLHTKWSKVTTILNGNDLQEMEIATGPLYARLLRAVRGARIDGLIRTKENEIAYVRKLLHEWGEANDG